MKALQSSGSTVHSTNFLSTHAYVDVASQLFIQTGQTADAAGRVKLEDVAPTERIQ